MLKFARNKVIGVTRPDRDTLFIHGILDDDIYGLEVDLGVRIRDLQFLSVSGKWNRWTTPECCRAIPFLQEIKGLRIDEEIDGRINKIVSRKGCRHFANLLIECCHAATEAARVARWEDAKAERRDLTFEDFRRREAGEEMPSERKASDLGSGGAAPSAASPPPPRVEIVREGTVQAEPRPGGPGRPSREFVIDLHVHTFPASPCSSASAEELIQEAVRIGLDGICFTDHNHVWPAARVEQLRQKYGFPVFRGNEITTDQGDMLVFGLEKDIRGIIKLQDLRKDVVEAGAFVIAAHPFRGFLTFSTEQLGLTSESAAQRPLFQWVDAVEVLNGKVTPKENRFAASVAETLGLPATGGSDAHRVSEVGIYATRFPMEIQTDEDLLRALANRSYITVAFRAERDAQARDNCPAEAGGR